MAPRQLTAEIPEIGTIGEPGNVLGLFVPRFVDAYAFLLACVVQERLPIACARKLAAHHVRYGYAKLHPEGDFPGDTVTRFRACPPGDPQRLSITYVLLDGGQLNRFSVAHSAVDQD